MNTDQEINRGHEAERIMSEPLVIEAFKRTEEGLVEALKRADLRDQKLEHEIVLSLQLLNRVKGYLRDVIDTGKMARIQRETAADRLRKVVGLR